MWESFKVYLKSWALIERLMGESVEKREEERGLRIEPWSTPVFRGLEEEETSTKATKIYWPITWEENKECFLGNQVKKAFEQEGSKQLVKC